MLIFAGYFLQKPPKVGLNQKIITFAKPGQKVVLTGMRNTGNPALPALKLPPFPVLILYKV